MELSSSVKDKSAEQIESAEQINPYDAVPYPSNAFAQTHPNHLATMATLFGMKPAPVKNCRVLELGCASGGNIIPMAFTLPESQFLGIDYSARQIEDGKKHVEALGLNNIELKQMNIMDMDKSLGKFDYIVAHGVLSWVPADVQEKILDLCQELLAENGVAYISYNALPGWHFRGIIRDMCVYHTALEGEPLARCQQSRDLLNFVLNSVPQENDAYRMMLQSEVGDMSSQDGFFVHEFLEGHNEPFYFHQFVERAQTHGLQYLSEAYFGIMLKSNFAKDVVETLNRLSNQIVRTEQYMDFIRNRAFRCTLLCRQEVVLKRNLGAHSLSPFYVGFPEKAGLGEMDVNSNESQIFRSVDGMDFVVSDPLLKLAFQHLSIVYPRTVKFDELVEIARSKLASKFIQARGPLEADAQLLGTALLTAYGGNFIVLRTESDPLVGEVSEHPTASALVRYQAKMQEQVTNQRHESFSLEAFPRQLVQLLDGSRGRTELIDELVRLVQAGKLDLPHESDNVKNDLDEGIDAALLYLAKTGVLTG